MAPPTASSTKAAAKPATTCASIGTRRVPAAGPAACRSRLASSVPAPSSVMPSAVGSAMGGISAPMSLSLAFQA